MRKRRGALKSRLVCCCFTFFLLRLATGDEAIILARPKDRLTGPSSWYWTGYKTDGSGWVGPSGSSTSYSVCDVGSLKPSNWLRSDGIHHNRLKKLDITIKYTMKRCSLFDDANARQNCTEHFDVYAYQTASKFESDSDPRKGNFTKIGTITLPSASVKNQSSSVERVAHLSLIMNERTSTVFFAIHDQGSCLSLISFVVSYRVCPRETLPSSLVVLPQTVAPTNESEVVKFRGKCAANSVPTSSELYAICNSKGEWITPDKSQGYCLCKAGWEKSLTECTVCSFDHYKDTDGNTQCRKCPKNSYAKADRINCKCSRGFYRAPEEGITHNCTAPPSSPRHAEKLVNQTSVILSWKPPRDLGGRSDLHYDVDCKKVCGKDQRSCSQDCGSQVVFMPRQSNITQAEVTISNLASGVTYRFRVYAKNAVSGAAEKEGRFSKHTELEVTTLDSVPGKPVVTVRRISSSTVHVTWGMKDASGRVHYYLLTYYKAKDRSDKHVINTTATEARISGLQPGAEYKFVVVARNSMGFGLSSDGVTSQDGLLDANNDERRKLWIVIALAAGGTILLLLIVSIIMVVMSHRRKLRKRGQKFEATELYPTRELSQYVDPSNYGDPMEALKTFAAEIDRSRIKLDCAVGGGEFAEVYKGLFETPEGTIYVAVKILKQGSSAKNKDDFISEASIMGQFKHPNVIDLKGVVTITRPMMIITEFMEGGSLDCFLKTNSGKLTSLQLIGMVRGVSSGMAYLSAINFVHRDLAARNILVGENMICKVSDFGLSRELEDNPDSEYQTQGGKIPIRWTAPEAIRYRKFSSASDVWSFGILLWETLSYGERPYWDWNNFEVIDRVEAGYLLPAPVNCPKIVHNLMLDCWEKDRTKRPKFDEIVRRLDELIRTPNMLRDNFVYYTSSVSADFTKLNTISEWLNSINMGQYAMNFKFAGYKDLTQVTCLKDTDLKEMGVTLIGHRNKIYKSVKAMRKHFDNMPEAV